MSAEDKKVWYNGLCTKKLLLSKFNHVSSILLSQINSCMYIIYTCFCLESTRTLDFDNRMLIVEYIINHMYQLIEYITDKKKVLWSRILYIQDQRQSFNLGFRQLVIVEL